MHELTEANPFSEVKNPTADASDRQRVIGVDA